jgi:hypothetical protein
MFLNYYNIHYVKYEVMHNINVHHKWEIAIKIDHNYKLKIKSRITNVILLSMDQIASNILYSLI